MSITIFIFLKIVCGWIGGNIEMNRDLPENKFFEDFYIWFNQEKKEEYYSTPLYYYKASFNIDYDTHTLKIYWKENEGTDNGLKHPATLYFPFVEKFGTFLVRFLNADLYTYETAYKDAGMKKEKNCTLSAYDLIVSQASKMVLDAKEQLSLLVKDAESLDASLYTASTYASLKSEVNESDNLIAQDTITLEQVVEAQVKLVNAKNALIDLSGLKSVVEQSNYVKDEYTKNSYRTYETALNQAKPVLENANSTAEEIQKAQEDLENAIQALVKKADFSILNEKVQEGYAFLESDKDMLEEASYTNFKNELDACSVVLTNDESTQDEINDSLARLNAYFENKDNFVYKVMTLENNVVAEPQKQMLDTPQLVVQEQVNTVQSVQTPSPKATTSAADNFIKTYLTSASGNVFTTANYLNYQKILSAMPSWLKLSSPDQKAVNTELKNKVGKTYQKLLQEAQNLKMNSGTSINTATNTDSTLYTWLCVMSLGMLTFVTKRLRKQD